MAMARPKQSPNPVRTKHHQLDLAQEDIIPVVYYLSRNNHLEHPHFVQVSISSRSEGPHLRDVINRLNGLRGKNMAAMYSWSCKRSYKNGFVWQDLMEDDLILPANRNEYILKGSLLLGSYSPPQDECVRRSMGIGASNSGKQLRQESGLKFPSERSQETSPSSYFSSGEVEPMMCRPSSPSSPTMMSGSTKKGDASTQTENRNEGEAEEGMTRNQRYKIGSSSTSFNNETMEYLIPADARKMTKSRELKEDGESHHVDPPTRVKLNGVNILMQLITCGLLPLKNHTNMEHAISRFSNPKFKSLVMRSSRGADDDDHAEEEDDTGDASSDSNSSTWGLKCVARKLKMGTSGNHQSKNGGTPRLQPTLTISPRISYASYNQIPSARKSSSNGGFARRSFDGLSWKPLEIEERLTSGARIMIRTRGSKES